MRDSSVVVVTLVLLTGLIAPVTVGTAIAQNDGNEPNDDLATATPIDPGTYDGLVIDGEEYDYYAVELSEGETLDVNIEHVEDIPGDVNVNIYNPDGDNVARADDFSDPTSDTVRVRSAAQAEQTGTYYILVSGVEEDVQIDYSLSVAVAANDRFEPNGDYAGATQLEPGTYEDLTMLSGEFDNYAVELEAGETLNATITYAEDEDRELEPDLDIRGPDGDRLQFSEEYRSPLSSTVARRATVEAEQSGTYYVQITGNDEYQTEVSYSLSVAVAENDRFEPNGDYASATQLEPGTYENLSILSDEQDYYAVELGPGETLNATLTHAESSEIDPSLDIYGPDGDSIQFAETYRSPTSDTVTRRATMEAEQSGTYYIEVSGRAEYQGQSPYSLSVEVAENDRFEPNGDYASATPLGPGTYENLSLLSGEHDYYAVDLSTGDTLNATISYDESVQLSLDLDINDPDGDLERDGELSTDPTSSTLTESATIEAERNDTYYVEVSGDGDYQGDASYALLIDAPEQSTPTPTATATSTATRTEGATTTTTTTSDTTSAETTNTVELTAETTTDTPAPESTDSGDAGPETTSGSGPGMGVVAALVGLLAGALVAARQS